MKKNKRVLHVFISITILVVYVFILLITNRDNELTKDEIVKIFVENKETFTEIQEYNGDYNSNEYLIKLARFKECTKGISVSRNRDSTRIWFIMDNQRGLIDKGILYIESDILPEVDPGMGECERIEKNWFYYVIKHT